MRMKAEKLKVPAVKLDYAVIERIWKSDDHPCTARLCSWDRIIAYCEHFSDADCVMNRKKILFPNYEYMVCETRHW